MAEGIGNDVVGSVRYDPVGSAGSDGAEPPSSGEIVDPAGGLWFVGAEVLPWEPQGAGLILDAVEPVLGSAGKVLLGRRTLFGADLARAELGEAVIAFVVTFVVGLVELLALAVVWPVWWLYRRLRNRPLPLVVYDPSGEWVAVPSDLSGFAIRGRRAQVIDQIRSGALRPVPASTPDRPDLSCAGPGQPLVRRSRPIRES